MGALSARCADGICALLAQRTTAPIRIVRWIVAAVAAFARQLKPIETITILVAWINRRGGRDAEGSDEQPNRQQSY